MVLQNGTAYFNLKRHGNDDVRTLAAEQQISLNRSSQFRVTLNQNELRLAAWNGQLDVLRRTGQSLEVRKNESLSLEFDDQGRYYLSKGVFEENQDYWDRDRDDERARYASVHNHSGYRDVNLG